MPILDSQSKYVKIHCSLEVGQEVSLKAQPDKKLKIKHIMVSSNNDVFIHLEGTGYYVSVNAIL